MRRDTVPSRDISKGDRVTCREQNRDWHKLMIQDRRLDKEQAPEKNKPTLISSLWISEWAVREISKEHRRGIMKWFPILLLPYHHYNSGSAVESGSQSRRAFDGKTLMDFCEKIGMIAQRRKKYVYFLNIYPFTVVVRSIKGWHDQKHCYTWLDSPGVTLRDSHRDLCGHKSTAIIWWCAYSKIYSQEEVRYPHKSDLVLLK